MAPAITDHIYITLFLGDAVLLCPLFRSDMIVPPPFWVIQVWRAGQRWAREASRWCHLARELNRAEVVSRNGDGTTRVRLWFKNRDQRGVEADVDTALETLKAEFDRFTAQDATFIIVTNEIGSGGTPVNDVQRRFTDLLGWLNQYVASKADEVVLMVSGIPVTIKTLHSSWPRNNNFNKRSTTSISRRDPWGGWRNWPYR